MAFHVAFYGIGLPLIICFVKHRNGMMITIHELFFCSDAEFNHRVGLTITSQTSRKKRMATRAGHQT